VHAEKAVLSRILLSGEWHSVMDRRVSAGLFQDEECRQCFQFVSDFYGQYSKVPSLELVEEQFPGMRFQLAKEPVEFYVDKLSENYVRLNGSKLLMASAEVITRDPFAGLEKLQSGVAQLALDARPTRDVSVGASTGSRKERYLRLKDAKGMDGHSTPWQVLNEATMGLHPGDFVAIVSRPAVGKTFMLTVFAEFAARTGLRVLFISNEMSDTQIMQRFDAVHFQLPYKELRAGLLPDALEERYFEGLDSMSVDMVVTEDVQTISAVSAKIDQYNPDLLLVDGMYLMRDEVRGSDQYATVSNVSRALKRLGKQKRIPVVATTQFNRLTDELRMDKVTLANLGFSDSIGQDADVVLGLFRTQDMRANNEMRVRMLKIREGEPKDFTLNWDLHRMNFEELDASDDDRLLDADDTEARIVY